MKKPFITALAAALLCGCTSTAPAEPEKEDLVVFAAASLKETMTDIKELYEAEHPEINVVYNFDSSGTLKTQIESGAECDVFISAAPKQMNQLDITADPEVNTDKLDFVLSETRFNLLENKVALAVPSGNPEELTGFDDLAARLQEGNILLAIGNSDVPVGQYTQKIFKYFNLDEEQLAARRVLTYGNDVKEVTDQVTEAAVGAGIIYATDAFSAGLEVIDTATPEMCGQVIYPAAVIKTTVREETARDFLSFLTSEAADGVFTAVGFTPLHE